LRPSVAVARCWSGVCQNHCGREPLRARIFIRLCMAKRIFHID
jgi:hypothetical protein